jgi:uncharacterized protein
MGISSPVLAQATSQDGRREPILTVLGKGRHEVKPDLTRFQATISTQARTMSDAARSHEERATRALQILQALKERGVRIEKSNFRIDERRVPQPLKPAEAAQGKRPETVVEGYVAGTTFFLNVTLLENLNEVVTKLVETGFFQVHRVQFHAADERAALNQARRAAMLDALDQAHAYTEPVNLGLGQIVAITDGEATPPDGMADIPLRATTGPHSVQIIPPATIEFTASVNVTWRIIPRSTERP